MRLTGCDRRDLAGSGAMPAVIDPDDPRTWPDDTLRWATEQADRLAASSDYRPTSA